MSIGENDNVSFNNSTVCINSVNVSKIETVNHNGSGNSLDYVMAGTSASAGLVAYNSDPVDEEREQQHD